MLIKIQKNNKYKLGSADSNRDALAQNQESGETSKSNVETNESQKWHQKFIENVKNLREKYTLKPKEPLDPELQKELDREVIDRMDKGTYEPTLKEQFGDIVGKFKKPKAAKPQGQVEESFTMEDLEEQNKSPLEKLKDLGKKLKKPKNESKIQSDENENLDANLTEIQESLSNKQESPGVIKNAIEKFKNLSPQDQKKLLLLTGAALGLSVVAIHAAIPVFLATSAGGVAGTGFGTFTGLGMGNSVLGFGAIEGVKGVAVGTAATMAKVYAGGIAAGAVGGGLLSLKNAGKILNREKLIIEQEESESIQSIEQQIQAKEISPQLQANIDKINATPNMSESRKNYEIGELIKSVPEKQIVDEQTQETLIQEPLEVVNAKSIEIAIETNDYNLWLNTKKIEGNRLGISEDDMDLAKVDFIKAKETKYKEDLGFKERKTVSKSLDNLEVLKAKSLVTKGLESVFDRCPPTNKLTIDGQEFLFSNVITSVPPEYPNVILWSNKQGKLMPRLIYKSQSSGTWRMDMGGRLDGGYGKGDHYTESSKLVPEIVSHLDNNIKILGID